jgi:hypothetical protein
MHESPARSTLNDFAPNRNDRPPASPMKIAERDQGFLLHWPSASRSHQPDFHYR